MIHGVFVTKLTLVHEDKRRTIQELFNGFEVRNLKILTVKEDSYLGDKTGHWHNYNEMMFIMEGEVKNYLMENIATGEREMYNFKAGDIVFRGPGIIHGGMFKAGTVVIDGSAEVFLSGDFNNIPREETK